MKQPILSGLAHAGLALVVALVPCAFPARGQAQPAAESSGFYTGQDGKAPEGIEFVQAITVDAPAYGAAIQGDTTVAFRAPGMVRVKAWCWQQPTAARPSHGGHDAVVADLAPGADGMGSFVFHADRFPNGPLTIRLHAKDDGRKQDICELQLLNRGGVVWNQGIPRADPPAAMGMKLAFADDFDGPLSVSRDGTGARYACHKTGGGDFSGWPFSDPAGDNDPFGQAGTFLRIHASKAPGGKGRTGILSSLRADGSGVSATPPCYFECRLVAHSAPGTWPAFWTLTKGTLGLDEAAPGYEALAKAGCDELDVIEGYGGYGRGHPNSGGKYSIVSHFWNQPEPAWFAEKDAGGKPNPLFKPHHTVVDTLALGARSSWSWTFHTYGVLVTGTDTVYYFDGIEVLRHPTGPVSRSQPTWFLINYAIGGNSGWPIDLERYGNASDMWVDYVRVYQGATQPDREASAKASRPTNPLDFSYPYADGTQERTIREVRDPAILREGDTYYLTFTHFPFTHHTSRDAGKPDNNSSPGIPLYSSQDLRHWRFENWLVKSSELPDDCPYKHRFWAPEIHKIGERFFLVFTADNWNQDAFNKGGRIGAYVAFVGVADRVTGPYQHITWLEGAGCDTSLFADDDGRTYAVMPFGDVFLQEVDLRGIDRGAIRLVGERTRIVSRDNRDVGKRTSPEYLEGPWLVKRNGKYVLFTAAPYRGPSGEAAGPPDLAAGYWTGAAVADHARGPYRKDPQVFLGGHVAVFTGPDGTDWLSYRGESGGQAHGRLCVDPLPFEVDAARKPTDDPSATAWRIGPPIVTY